MKETDFSILAIRTLVSIPVCLYSVYVNTTNTDLTNLVKIIGLTTCFDFLFAEGSMVLHHSFTLVFCASFLYGILIDYDFASRSVIASEYSTIFLLMHRWLEPRSIHSTINQVAFFAAFAWYRIIKFYFRVITNEALYKEPTTIYLFFPFASLFAFYFLNLYWFALIIKKVYDERRRRSRSLELNCVGVAEAIYNNVLRLYPENKEAIECLLQYTYGPNLPLAFAMYITSHPQYTPFCYIVDILGIQNLALSSYDYHRVLRESHFDHDSPEVVRYYWYDIASIKLRGFLPLVTILYSGKDTIYSSLVVFASAAINTTTFYLMTCWKKPTQFPFFYRVVLVGLPVAIDTLLLGSYSLGNPSRLAELLVCLVSVISVYSVKPWGHASTLLIHAFSLWQTYIFCQIVIHHYNTSASLSTTLEASFSGYTI